MTKEEWKLRIPVTSGFAWLEEPIEVDVNTSLFITHCCADKNKELEQGTAEQLYIGNRNKRFYSYVKLHNYRYCTVSDKYGIITPEQIIETYNVAPSDLTEEDIVNLKLKIQSQFPNNVDSIFYYGASPSMTEFYLKLFKNVEVQNKYFITKFCYLDNVKKTCLF